MRRRLNNIFFCVGIVAVVIMLITFDVSFSELWLHLTHAGYWVVAILALWAVLYVLNTIAWGVIIDGGRSDEDRRSVPFWRLYRLTVTGFALNYSTPFGLMGGEAYRIMELEKHIGVQRATSSVILFVMMHIFSHFWFWMLGVVTYIVLAAVGDLPMSIPLAVILGFVCLFCYGGIYLFVRGYKNGMVVRLVRLVSRVPGLRSRMQRFEEAHREDLSRIDRQIAELQSQNKRSFYGSFFLELFGRLCQCFEIMFMLILFGVDGGGTAGGLVLTYLHSFLILAFTSLFANILGFLPLQLGGREGGFAMSVVQMGMTDGIAMFVSIICRAREIFWTIIGLLLMKIKK